MCGKVNQLYMYIYPLSVYLRVLREIKMKMITAPSL